MKVALGLTLLAEAVFEIEKSKVSRQVIRHHFWLLNKHSQKDEGIKGSGKTNG